MEDRSAVVDVLVVGAGPTGLTLASEAIRHGLTCRVVDELAAPITFSKAAVVHSRTMEVFDAMGMAAPLAEHARLVHGLSVFAAGKRIAHVTLAGVDSPFPFPCGISQQETERALAAHLASLGGTVERGTRIESLELHDDHVTARQSTGGTIDARWIVGCDGAHSVVRKACGCSFEGSSYEERLIQADVRVDLGGAPTSDEIMAFLHDDGPLLLFPLFRDGRYRLIVFLKTGSPEVEPTLDVFQRMLDERGPPGARVSDPAWMIPFRIHHRHTDRYRTGRALLAGDAAHIHSPVGGQGMNTGIQDAHNLAWKLALVARGIAHESLLDSYEAERAPVAHALLGATHRAMQGLELAVGLRNPVAKAVRDHVISFVTGIGAVRDLAARTISMITVGYPESPIVRQDRPSLWKASVGGHATAAQPSLEDWAAFGDAPGPGARVVDAPLDGHEGGRGGCARLYELLRGTRHVALLFDGAAEASSGHRNLERVARRLRERLGSEIDAHVVVAGGRKPEGLAWDGSIVLDTTGALHRRYGARNECIYVVRPDGYVGYRAQPVDEVKLFAYLATIFRGA